MSARSTSFLLLALSLAPLTQSCVSNHQHQRAMDEKDETIRQLRDERASLKGDIAKLRAGLDQAHTETTEAAARAKEEAPAPAPAPSTTQKFPELDKVGVSYGERDGHMVISIPAGITFASGQATLSKEGRAALDKVAATLKKAYPTARYSIEGHTDSDPIHKSSFSSNRELSVARAMAVLSYLVTECNVPDERCIVAGHGQYDPVAGNDKDTGKAKNRRVEIVVLSAHK